MTSAAPAVTERDGDRCRCGRGVRGRFPPAHNHVSDQHFRRGCPHATIDPSTRRIKLAPSSSRECLGDRWLAQANRDYAVKRHETLTGRTAAVVSCAPKSSPQASLGRRAQSSQGSNHGGGGDATVEGSSDRPLSSTSCATMPTTRPSCATIGPPLFPGRVIAE